MDIELQIRNKGHQIFQKMESQPQSVFNKDYWYGRIMDWSMKNESFKTNMFRFVDVLPCLDSSQDVARHLKEYFSESQENLPSVFNVGLGIGSLAPGLMAGAVRKNVTQMAKMFIAGESISEARDVFIRQRRSGCTFTVDLLGEAALSEREAEGYQTKYMDLMVDLIEESKKWPSSDLLDTNHLGSIPKVNVSVKLSSLFSQINVKAWEETKEILKARLRPLFRKACSNSVFINLDMEQYSIKDLTLEVFEELIFEDEFKHYPHWGCVIQAYLKDSLKDIERLIATAKRRNVPFTVRLVKGAYWDYETVLSAQRGWPTPVFTNKNESDANYEDCTSLLLTNSHVIHAALASHNVRSLAAALVKADSLNLDRKSFELQMLYGMADPIKKSLCDLGYRVREYTPVGELIPGMAYLVRRLLENTSNESFLRSKFAENVSTENLLRNPRTEIQSHVTNTTGSPSKTQNSSAPKTEPFSQKFEFTNEPFLDFSIAQNRTDLQQALVHARSLLRQDYPLIIGGKEVHTSKKIESVNPSRRSEILGRVSCAGANHASEAMKSAREAFSSWKMVPVETRAQTLETVADLILKRRLELAAIEVLEVGKTWAEADGDVTEAIDFCRYYAKSMRRLSISQTSGSVPGETNLYLHRPRGVSVVIAPWNFPLAILCGMVTASLVTGNTVVMKPAEQSGLIAAEFMKILILAGVPKGVVNFLPGLGEDIGPVLAQSPESDIIAFTGSRAVGLEILSSTSVIKPGQRHIKKSILEMGGKNAIIVDSDADLDEAVQGTITSAFGFSGQKCSACSRVIVVRSIYERFLERLIEGVKSLKTGSAEDPSSFVGPVVDGEAYHRILGIIEKNKTLHRGMIQSPMPSGVEPEGYSIPATVFWGVDPSSELAQEEIFGPVLAVIEAETFSQAISLANDTAYGLTGGVYSRSPAHISQARDQFDVGNLYINRSITGALVHRHPFGGFKLSGVGSKTGGVDYLLQFMEPRSVSENTLRRGFAPATEES